MRIALLLLLVFAAVFSFVFLGAGKVTAAWASGDPHPPATPIPPTLFGMHRHVWPNRPEPWPEIPFGSLRLWDSATGWAQLNTGKGQYDWSQLDKWYADATEHHVEDILYTFGRVPQFASSNPGDRSCGYGPGQCQPPKDLKPDGSGSDEYWRDFVTAIVTHNKNSRGVHIKYWELWNEPYLPSMWSGTIPQLMRMARDAKEILQRIDPDAVLLTAPAPLHWPKYQHFLEEYLAAGGGQYADVISFHGYVRPPSSVGDFYSNYAEYRRTLAKYGQDSKPVFDTEGSWGNGQQEGFTDEDKQAAFLAQAYLAHWSQGVLRFYWYAYNGGIGSLSDPRTSRGTKAAAAYREVFHWLVGAVMTKPCAQDGSTWTCSITKADGHEAQIVWTDADEKTYNPKPMMKKVRDVEGHTNPVSATVKIGSKPVLFEAQ
jgi:hypothetical protein